MKYIIMCGGEYKVWEEPRQLTKINGEPIVARTIRLLKERGVTDIAISSNNPVFEQFGVPVLKHNNYWEVYKNDIGLFASHGTWVNAFYPTDYPVCYLFGDVVFSPPAIRKIVETETDDIEFFASAPPFSANYFKSYAEPFAFKVVNTKHLKEAILKVKQFDFQGKFRRDPIAWELWQVIKDTPINKIDYTNYTVINDYTCDIDSKQDIEYFRFVQK